MVFRDGFVEAAECGQRYAQIRVGRDDLRMRGQEFLIFLDGQRVIARLLRLLGFMEKFFDPGVRSASPPIGSCGGRIRGSRR
jgi:hypothetical protein